MKFHLRGPLREAAGDGDGSGGGDGDVFNEDQVKAIETAVNNAINKYDASNKKATKKLESSLLTISESISALSEKINADPDDGGGDTDGGGGNNDDGKGGKNTQQNTELHKLTKQFNDLKKQFDASETARQEAEAKAEKTERESALQTALSQHKFASLKAREAVFTMMFSEIDRDEDGNLVVGDIALDEHVKTQLESDEFAVFLEPERKGGAGASGGTPPRKGSLDLDNLKPGASKEDRAAAAREISNVLQQG